MYYSMKYVMYYSALCHVSFYKFVTYYSLVCCTLLESNDNSTSNWNPHTGVGAVGMCPLVTVWGLPSCWPLQATNQRPQPSHTHECRASADRSHQRHSPNIPQPQSPTHRFHSSAPTRRAHGTVRSNGSVDADAGAPPSFDKNDVLKFLHEVQGERAATIEDAEALIKTYSKVIRAKPRRPVVLKSIMEPEIPRPSTFNPEP